MNQLKRTMISLLIGALVFLGISLWFIAPLWLTNQHVYTKSDLIQNYETKSREILVLVSFIKSKISKDNKIEIEFSDNSNLEFFHVKTLQAQSSNWNLGINDKKVDSLLNELKVTREFLFELKNKLDEAHCISIENGEPVTVGYQRSGMAKYFYKVFETKLDSAGIDEYNDSCKYIFYKDNIVLEYGGGAIGPQCFE